MRNRSVNRWAGCIKALPATQMEWLGQRRFKGVRARCSWGAVRWRPCYGCYRVAVGQAQFPVSQNCPNSLLEKSAAIRKAPQTYDLRGFNDGGRGRNRTGVGGFAIRSITTLLLGLKTPCYTPQGVKTGAGNETRTRDPDLGKVVLYQLSYSRVVLTGAILSNRHGPSSL